ncbi:MAG: NAD(+) synthase, partial [Lachnospiraceae bacterium]|nr:NAD(+) synthase [Lachnospiraceae bacterium]
TGYSCGELFVQEPLLAAAEEGLEEIRRASEGLGILIFVGLPIAAKDVLYNVAAAICDGKILGLVPKRNIPNYHEFYEKRYFHPGLVGCEEVWVNGQSVLLGGNLIFSSQRHPELRIGCEICEDLWVPSPPSTQLALSGANVIVNLSASNELVGKSDYRRSLVMNQSARLYTIYVYASCGSGESTQDTVYSGHRLICENGRILAESNRFELLNSEASADTWNIEPNKPYEADGLLIADADVGAALARRRATSSFTEGQSEFVQKQYITIEFDTGEPLQTGEGLLRWVDPHPFVPQDERTREERCDEILNIQTAGLVKRLRHAGQKTAVVGISGGLDSTLALIVATMAFDKLGLDKQGVLGITMPGFGTTDRTYDNACELVKSLGATLMEIPIADAVRQHFADIGHDESKRDVVYENAQARERTQILMDVANEKNGLVVGTGDLSELALGWATYNGDHMSMYGVNAGVPKTLVRHLVRYYATSVCEKGSKLAEVLLDVLDTPVSPELLPPEDGQIAQKTENLVGPYELHDFFLYYMVRFGFHPAKIFRLTKQAFAGAYDGETILQWMRTFYRRFFAQQFKRSCLPDGPKVGTVALSPRGDWRMPSDAQAKVWLAEIEKLVYSK